MNKSFFRLLVSGTCMILGLSSCGKSGFYALSDEKKTEYAEQYMLDTYGEEWTANGIITRTEKLADKIPSGMYVTTLDNPETGDVVIMWLSSEGEVFEDRFMLRMREPAKAYLVKKIQTALPDTRVFAYITIDYPELYGDYRKTGNIEPLLTEPNLYIRIEVFSGSDRPFKSEDIQTLASALKDVQFDIVNIWECDEKNITGTLKTDSELKISSRKKWYLKKDSNGKFECRKGTDSGADSDENR